MGGAFSGTKKNKEKEKELFGSFCSMTACLCVNGASLTATALLPDTVPWGPRAGDVTPAAQGAGTTAGSRFHPFPCTLRTDSFTETRIVCPENEQNECRGRKGIANRSLRTERARIVTPEGEGPAEFVPYRAAGQRPGQSQREPPADSGRRAAGRTGGRIGALGGERFPWPPASISR